MEEYEYRGNKIHKSKDGMFYAYTMNLDGDIDETPANSMERAMEIIDRHEISIAGHYFDLDETTRAYELGGVNKHWTDYTEGEEEWDENSYYEDFGDWWDYLPFEEQKRIYEQINPE